MFSYVMSVLDSIFMISVEDHMNMFRLSADLLHMTAIVALLLKICITRDCAGISGKSQILFTIVFTTRYLDLTTVYISIFNTVVKIIFLVLSHATVLSIFLIFRFTYDRTNDSLRIEFLVIPAFGLAMLINHAFVYMEILWTFSIYLEAVAIVPQLFMVLKTNKVERIMFFYLLGVGLYRALYLVNWIYRYYAEGHYDLIPISAGIVQTIIFSSFIFKNCIIGCAPSLKSHVRNKLKPLFGQLQNSSYSMGRKPDPKYIGAIKNFPIPENKKQVEQFLDLVSYYRQFVNNFSRMAKPLNDLVQNDAQFFWSHWQQDSFEYLKNTISSEPVLQFPDYSKGFIVITDVSSFAIGAVLSQGTLGNHLPVEYASRTLTNTEIDFSTTEKELLAIISAVTNFRPYLEGRKFTLVTDYIPAVSLDDDQSPAFKRMSRWQTRLNKFDYEIISKTETENCDVDSISRSPCPIHGKQLAMNLQINDEHDKAFNLHSSKNLEQVIVCADKARVEDTNLSEKEEETDEFEERLIGILSGTPE